MKTKFFAYIKNRIKEKFPDCFEIDFSFELKNIKQLNL